MNSDSHNNPVFAFMKLKKEVKGVKHAFIFPKNNTENSGNSLEKGLKYLISCLPTWSPPKKISIQTFKGEIIVYATEAFFVGAVITNDANSTLVEMILARIASTLDDYVDNFKATTMKPLEEKIQRRIERTLYRAIPVTVTLMLKNVGVEGDITVSAAAQNEDYIKREIQEILDEEIPFFCEKHITIHIKTK